MPKKKKSSSVAAKTALAQILEEGGQIITTEHPERKHVNRKAVKALEKRLDRRAEDAELGGLPMKAEYEKIARQFNEAAGAEEGFPKVSATYNAVHVEFNRASGEQVDFFIPVKGMLSERTVKSIERKTGLQLIPQN